MAKNQDFSLCPDKKGVTWDLLLYVPTVLALGSIALQMYYSPGSDTWSYLLMFLASFFFFVGFNRISTRMQLLPSSPVGINVSKQQVKIRLRNGNEVELVKDLRFFSDYAGRSFGLSAMDMTGKKCQYVFHKGQFASEQEFKDLTNSLRAFA